MNPFLNPKISIPFLKNYITDPGRIERLSPQRLEKYRNRALQKILKYASSVPLYQKKYEEAHINPQSIKTTNDITKLPFITKQNLRDYYPDGITPKHYNKKNGYVVSTGGTSGKSVSIYTDFPTILRALGPPLAQMHYFHLNLRKIRAAHIGNFNRYRIDGVTREHFFPHLKHFYQLDNTLNLDVNEPIKTLMDRLNTFKPDIIISYPTVFQHLAFLKKKGLGENVNPSLMQVGGSILDEYTRSYVEDAFRCPLLNIYLSVESQACIAFECREHNWHIHSDFFYVEAIDQHNELVAPGERGRIVITRLWGQGTPIIRYTGMEDLITLNDNETCSCGLHSPIFKKPVEGRMQANIVLPNGTVFPCGAFCFIEPVLNDLKTFKIKQYQVVQKKINEIDILLVIDEDLRNIGAPVEEIIARIKKIYQEKTGPDVTISVYEVPEIKTDPKSNKPTPIVISYVSQDEGYKQLSKV